MATRSGHSSADLAYLVLHERFGAGEYAPGQRLTEVSLAKALGMSRTPVREAMSRLQADGLLVPASRGMAVAELSREEVRDLYELRAVLEGLAARLAAANQREGRLAPSQVSRLEALAAQFADRVDETDPRAAGNANLELHKAIAAASGNGFVEEALRRIWDRIAISSVGHLFDARWARTVTKQHRAIVTAIKKGDPDGADAAAHAHIVAASEVQPLRDGPGAAA